MISKFLVVFSLAVGLMLLATNPVVSVAGEGATTIKGKVVCLGCTLKKTEGAHAACKIYGHKHGLLTEDGTLYSFLENKASEGVITTDKYAKKDVEVTGRVFENAHIIDLENINVVKKKGGGYGGRW
ncbi:MAG: hypothetical protein ACE5IC_06080 [Candidatus Brocadiales bacterium]